MSQLFSLDAQVCGIERHVLVASEGFGITVDRDGDLIRARTATDAARIARDYIAEHLRSAQRGDRPWGCRVAVSDGIAVYGEWPLVPDGSSNPSFRSTPLVRIRDRWHPGSSALSALENAMQIVREYLPRGSSRLAA